jgi:predicted transcriptional regulator
MDADLDIVCTDRKIVILPTEDVVAGEVPEELLGICEELGIPKEKVNIVLRMTEEN